MTGIDFPDVKDPSLYEQGVPWDIFAAMRRDDPVHWTPEKDGAGFWSITKQADIVEVSRQPVLFSSAYEHGGHRIFNENEVGLTGAGESAVGIPMISCDPPLHTSYRKFMMPAVSPVRLAGIEARIRDRVEALVAAIPLGEPVDLVQLLNAPLPLLTMCELLGIPAEMWEDLYEWTNVFVGEDDPDFRPSADELSRSLGEFFSFAKELYEARKAEPGPDIASLLVHAKFGDTPLSYRDFLGNLILVLVGANETTRNTLSHTMCAFAADPSQWALLRNEPALLAKAPSEMVRFASPVLHMRRTATADTEIRGRKIAKGDKVVMWYLSGNRDEEVYEAPERFDLTKAGRPHVGFGSGVHVCIGSRLAEMQLRVAFGILAGRVGSFTLVAPPRRFRSNFLNGLKNLDMILSPV